MGFISLFFLLPEKDIMTISQTNHIVMVGCLGLSQPGAIPIAEKELVLTKSHAEEWWQVDSPVFWQKRKMVLGGSQETIPP